MPNMNDVLRQAAVMQRKLSKLQEEAATKTYEAASGGGMVKAVVSGKQELKSLTIDPRLSRAETSKCCRTSSSLPSTKPTASPGKPSSAR